MLVSHGTKFIMLNARAFSLFSVSIKDKLVRDVMMESESPGETWKTVKERFDHRYREEGSICFRTWSLFILCGGRQESDFTVREAHQNCILDLCPRGGSGNYPTHS